MNQQEDAIEVLEVAKLLRISRSSVYLGAGRGEIPHRRVGRRLIFSRKAILEWRDGTSEDCFGR